MSLPSSDWKKIHDWLRAGKKLNMGKSCIRFKKLDDLPLAAIGELISNVPVEAFLANYERQRGKKRA